ncbi:MAG: hypothetical protein ACLGI5_12935 [Thermoleophilia bacterium]
MSFGGDVKLYLAPDERVPPPGAPTGGYATLGQQAPTAWPSGFASYGGRTGNTAPVTGQLSDHAKAALRRMGITQD